MESKLGVRKAFSLRYWNNRSVRPSIDLNYAGAVSMPEQASQSVCVSVKRDIVNIVRCFLKEAQNIVENEEMFTTE